MYLTSHAHPLRILHTRKYTKLNKLIEIGIPVLFYNHFNTLKTYGHLLGHNGARCYAVPGSVCSSGKHA